MVNQIEQRVFWPVINGVEIEVSYQMECIDKWPDRDDEPAGEVWEFLPESASTSFDGMDLSDLDLLAEKDAENYVNR